MPKTIQRVGVLTGGGDCPGINAVIRAVTKTAIYRYKARVFGIEDGFLGLVENRIGELTSIHVSGILTRGGTILGTNNRCNPTRYYTGDDKDGKPIFTNVTGRCLKTIEANRLDALIVIGGDGTMSCAAPIAEAGVDCIAVPKTIDNDVVGTDITFGFLTAVSTATDALDRLHSTAMSHHRVMVCEVMGRNAGWIALHAGLASGSDVILIPEIPYRIETICEFVERRMHRGWGFSIIACAEGARAVDGRQVVADVDPTKPEPVRLGGVGQCLAQEIAQRTQIEARTTVLGYIQRSGTPTAADRVLATQFGHHAVELMMSGARNRMVVMRDGRLGDIDIRCAADKQRLVPLDDPLLAAARAVRTCFGDKG
ncbi:MAG: 6-phosphofructokinase [Planctomycetes bacterium]|nr:6-phosphofructokinase [Planctomycetota bacterium]